MSLVIDISLNRVHLTTTLLAQRIKGDPGERCTYRLKAIQHELDVEIPLGAIEHDFDDGADILAGLVIDRYLTEEGKR